MNYTFSDKVSGLKASAIREILKFTADPSVISFAAGNPAPESFPVDEIREITTEIFSKDPIAALQYSITEGHTPLRNRLKDMLTTQNEFNENIDDLIITSGAQQANELACKVILNEGDTLICENPSFIGSINSFKSYNVNLVGVELESDGINISKLEQALKIHKNVKILYLIPNFQNPTGVCMSLEKRIAVYKLAQKYDFLILEDNPYGYLRFEGEDIPSIKSLDTDGRVIYTSSFSKILAPGIRVGYVSAPKEVIQKIVVCKQVSDVHTNIWAQMLCDKFLDNVELDTHINKIREIYKRKSSIMINGIETHFSKKVSFLKPQGGLFLWCTLPDGSDIMEFANRAVKEHKIAIVPGSAFNVSEQNSLSFRLNFSTPIDEQIVKGCEILGKLSCDMFGE